MKQFLLILCVSGLLLMPSVMFAQGSLEMLHGDEQYSFRNFHSGNQIRTSFYNDGMVGRRDTNPDDIGEWPINSGRSYINLITFFLGAEVKDQDGIIRHIVSEANGVATGDDSNAASGDTDDNGNWQTLAPLPGFADPDFQRIAMSHQTQSWPATWPDKFDDILDPGWAGSWNGYFGKDVLNADQESYYVMDDYLNSEWNYFPDETDSLRRGLGLRGTVRGFQWSNVLVEDVLFKLVDVKNVGTTNHAKMNFGIVSGPVIGRLEGAGGDGADDGGKYDLDRSLGWHWDGDDIGAGGWTPVGVHGFAYFESPGNPYDGIDNDSDADSLAGPVITEDMFVPRTINAGDEIILIDYDTFERTKTTMPAEGITITYLFNTYQFNAGDVYEEIPTNLIDDNFNGIIDENNGFVFGEGDEAVKNYLYVGRKYVDYFTGAGLDNILLDERRDDGIDNDDDWIAEKHDVGLDGVPRTGDPGEGDGVPTSGAGTGLPGEPKIDKTDIDESDMIGLTAFNIFNWGNPTLSDDEGLWNAIEPGFLNAYGQIADTDLMLGSGYFPLSAGDIERFSLGIMFGISEDDLFANKKYAEKTYLENYNFAKAPEIPELTIIPGDNKVTLIWDDAAEFSDDPITGKDFEGYRIYRSTDPGWLDMAPITDGMGSVSYRKPIAQFDLDNGISGFSGIHVRGVEFYLGDDTGITHTFVDTTVRNGQKYYYAVTSYDRGDLALGVAPSECSKYIAVAKDGSIKDAGKNVGAARPEAPSSGFVEAGLEAMTKLEGSTATGQIGFEVVNPGLVENNASYRVSFEDTLIENDARWLVPMTKNFSLISVDTGDTLINKSTNLKAGAEQPLIDGFTFKLFNPAGVEVVADSSGWRIDSTRFEPDSAGRAPYVVEFEPFRYSRTQGVAAMRDYRIDFYDEVGVDTSLAADFGPRLRYDAMPVNFTVTDLNTGEKVPFAFDDADQADGEEGFFTALTGPRERYADQIIFLEPNKFNQDTLSWSFAIDRGAVDSLHRRPKGGDYYVAQITKPFLANDTFEFTTAGRRLDAELVDLDNVRVVPNPYVVSNSWEPANPYNSGRGPRELHFTNLPPQCTIKIFNIRGQLVRELEHNHADNLANGTEIWDMLTKDLLDISYGIYIYHVDAGEFGTKIGKFAVIK